MKKVMLGNKEIKVNNKREKNLVGIINQKIKRCVRYFENNTFGDVRETRHIVSSNLREIRVLISALFFMGVIPDSWGVSSIIEHDTDFFREFF